MINELIETEQDYVKDLGSIVEVSGIQISIYTTFARKCKLMHEIFHTEQGLHRRRWSKTGTSWFVHL